MAPRPSTADHLQVRTEGRVLIVQLNRPNKLNCISSTLAQDLERLLDWYELEPSLWALVLTGTGRAFCAGSDLTEFRPEDRDSEKTYSRHGFASLSRRYSTKPFICALNGLTFGGGLEIVTNADLVIAGESVKLGFPEVIRGLTAAQGGIPRVAAICGHVLASELLLTGKTITAIEARDRYGFVNKVVPDGEVLSAALKLAQEICANSPDAVQLTKRSLEEARRVGCNGVEKATIRALECDQGSAILTSKNFAEGLLAFKERRKPQWRDPPQFPKAKL